VVEKAGRVIILQDGTPLDQPFLDIRSRVGSDASERGLLSIAFHPNYASNGQFFLNYTNLEGDTVIARYQVTDDANVADPNSESILLVINQPAANHNGGHILFGPDGYLYIGMGDGGQAGDPWGNAQNRNVLLGKILRIDVDGEPPYAIPPDNPFVGQEEAQPEIWAWGVRNPWRMTFDRATGDFYIADVGQNMYEEVHLQPASSRGGENYGWDIMEGAECFPETETCDKAGLEMPIVVYSHRAGNCSITGGYVYRGPQFPVMHGIYFYADYCSGMLWALNQRAGDWQNRLMLETGMSISSFGEDEQGELYVTDLWGGGVYQVEGDGRP
jgi:glucose/arabinose dehydrogenase